MTCLKPCYIIYTLPLVTTLVNKGVKALTKHFSTIMLLETDKLMLKTVYLKKYIDQSELNNNY